MAALILLSAFAAWMLDVGIGIGFRSILTFFQYFLSGILLCDIFLLDSNWLACLDGKVFFALGLIFLVLITCTEHALSASPAMRCRTPFDQWAESGR